jgi:hypothetical protein
LEQGKLLLLLGYHLVLTGLPVGAAMLLAARRGVRQVPVLLAIGLAASGAVAMVGFWSYYGTRELGETYSYFVAFGSALAIAWILWEKKVDSELLRQLTVPLGLWTLGSVFLLFFGFVHGGADTPLNTAMTRFSHPLPGDNDIPRFYSEWFYLHGHHGKPAIFPGEWLATDRPPLQIGYVLSQRPFGWDEQGLHYQVLGVVLQQLWIVGIWGLLVAAGVGRITRALVVVTVLVSGVALVNGFFVWPKMLPTAMLLAAAALIMTPLWMGIRRHLWAGALVAALFALAMLGHGSSAFGIIPLGLIAAVRGLPSWRWLGVALVTVLLLTLPWSAYQKYGDPPGNRVTKWMLAGDPGIDKRGTTEAILDGYREIGLGGALHDKAENFVSIVGGGPASEALSRAVDAAKSGDLTLFATEVRVIFFFYLVLSLGLLLIAPFVMVAARHRGRRRSADWRLAISAFLIVLIGAIAWGLLLFGDAESRTVLHQGSYLLPVLALVGAVAGLRACSPRFSVYYVSASAALVLALYMPSFEPPAGTSYSLLAGLIAAGGLVGFCIIAFRGSSSAWEEAPVVRVSP